MADDTHDPTPEDITQLLQDWGQSGDRQALDRLIPLVTDELHRIARSFLGRERADHTLQPTALVHEAYLRLIDRRRASWQDRVHFFSFAARTMRRILVEHARRHQAAKRGGGAHKVPLDEAHRLAVHQPVDLLALDEAITTLSGFDPRQGRIVELRYFAGLTVQEIAEVVQVGTATVSRDLAMARAWLRGQLQGKVEHP
jgi:RNA polymerase sigma-70 factor, ECF subfamily